LSAYAEENNWTEYDTFFETHIQLIKENRQHAHNPFLSYFKIMHVLKEKGQIQRLENFMKAFYTGHPTTDWRIIRSKQIINDLFVRGSAAENHNMGKDRISAAWKDFLKYDDKKYTSLPTEEYRVYERYKSLIK